MAAAPSVWTLGHVTNQVHSWLNVRFQQLAPQALISDPRFRTGGDGAFNDWQVMLAAVTEVRGHATPYMDKLTDHDLDRVIPYDGSIPFLRQTGLPLRYALMRIVSHHYIHYGEIATIRSRIGRPIFEGPDWGNSLV